MPDKPAFFPHLKFIYKTFISCFDRTFHKLPASLWNICNRLCHLSIGINGLLCYNRFVKQIKETADHESVLFDFVVIDDQTFSFHMKEVEVSIPYFSFIQMMLQKLRLVKQVIIS